MRQRQPRADTWDYLPDMPPIGAAGSLGASATDETVKGPMGFRKAEEPKGRAYYWNPETHSWSEKRE